MITVAEVRTYCGAPMADDVFLTGLLAEAQALITAYIRDTRIPESVMDNCVTQVTRELWFRRDAPAGITQFASMDGVGLRVSTDPLISVYPLLDRYVQRGV